MALGMCSIRGRSAYQSVVWVQCDSEHRIAAWMILIICTEKQHLNFPVQFCLYSYFLNTTWLSWRSLVIAEHSGSMLGTQAHYAKSSCGLLSSSLSHLPLGGSTLAVLTQGLGHMTLLQSLR